MWKEEIDKLFYEHYFQEISVSENIDIKNFVSPTNTTANTVFKTINNNYIMLVKKSNKFIVDFFKQMRQFVV